MIPGRPRCSAESLSRHESLAATASLVSAWLLIEQPGAWGPDALTDSGFPDTAQELVIRADRLGIRVLLIRRRATQNDTRTVFLAHSGSGDTPPLMKMGLVADPTELADLDLEGMPKGRLPDFGEDVEGPVYLVCTHGRHDICCADQGRPLFRTLARHRPDQTWETSHVGGDRFAGNMVALPRGDYFGRVTSDRAVGLVDVYEAGRLDLAHHRGRSIHPRLAQAAEHYLREHLQLAGIDDLVLAGYRRLEGRRAEVVFQDRDGSSHRVEVTASTVPDAVFLTCRAPDLGQGVVYDVTRIEGG